MNMDEFQVTLPSNSSVRLFPNNKPNCYKTNLPIPLELEGDWEVALMDIQFPFNWPNFQEENIALVVRIDGDDVDEKNFKDNCLRTLQIYADDKEMRKLQKNVEEYLEINNKIPTGIKLIKIPTASYEHVGELASMLTSEFNKDHYNSKKRIQLQTQYNSITKKLDFIRENIKWFEIISLGQEFCSTLGYPIDTFNDVLYVVKPPKTRNEKTNLDRLNSMYIYCDVIRYQIVGDIQAPLLGTLPIQGKPNDQIYWCFNPAYYMPVNQRSISTIQMRICTDTGDLFPFDPSGRVVCRLHFRRKRALW